MHAHQGEKMIASAVPKPILLFEAASLHQFHDIFAKLRKKAGHPRWEVAAKHEHPPFTIQKYSSLLLGKAFSVGAVI